MRAPRRPSRWVPSTTDEARKALAAAAQDDDPVAPVRAAAMLALIKPGAGRPKVIAMEKYLRDPSPELRAAAAAGVVRAGGSANLDDLYVLFKDNDPRPALAALRELERVPSDEATKLIARLAKRPQLEVQRAAAELLLRRDARDYYASMKPYLEPKTDPTLRAVALAGVDERVAAGGGGRPGLGNGVYRARLARGEREQAIDWFLAYGAKLQPRDAGRRDDRLAGERAAAGADRKQADRVEDAAARSADVRAVRRR